MGVHTCANLQGFGSASSRGKSRLQRITIHLDVTRTQWYLVCCQHTPKSSVPSYAWRERRCQRFRLHAALQANHACWKDSFCDFSRFLNRITHNLNSFPASVYICWAIKRVKICAAITLTSCVHENKTLLFFAFGWHLGVIQGLPSVHSTRRKELPHTSETRHDNPINKQLSLANAVGPGSAPSEFWGSNEAQRGASITVFVLDCGVASASKTLFFSLVQDGKLTWKFVSVRVSLKCFMNSSFSFLA